MSVFILKLLSVYKFHKYYFIITILLGVLLCFYLLHYIFIVKEPREFINILKDLKLFLLIPMGFIFMVIYYRRLQEILTKKFCINLLLANLVVLGVVFYFMVTRDLHLRLTDDPYYKHEELRLETLGSYFGIFYLS